MLLVMLGCGGASTGSDLNGDGRADWIEADFTGGAHCCYRLTAHLSGCEAPLSLPLIIDGGGEVYDLVDPDGDGTESLLAVTHTYSGRRDPLPEVLAAAGVTNNTILAHFSGCTVRLEGLPWTVRSPRQEAAGPHTPAVAAFQDPHTGLHGYTDADGAVTIPALLEEAGPFVDGLALVRPVHSTERWAITPDGALRFALPGWTLEDRFSEGLLPVQRSGAAGYLGTDGQWAIAPTLGDAKPFAAGLAPAMAAGSGLWGYIDRTGAWVIPPQFSAAHPFQDGAAAAWRSGPVTIARDGLGITAAGG